MQCRDFSMDECTIVCRGKLVVSKSQTVRVAKIASAVASAHVLKLVAKMKETP